MADDGPQQRPPFSDPHDPRWYSDPGMRGPGASGAAGPAGEGPSGAHAAGTDPHGTRPYPFGGADPGRGFPHGGQEFGSTSYRQPETLPYGSYPAPYGAEPRGMSIAALILGAAAVFTGGLLLLPQILAVVFGHLALRREPAGRPLALTGLIMGYVMLLVGLLLLVGFILLVVLGAAASVTTGP
ncbi:DUF4190 domain-containing protein [Arthrobacter sp. MSA 4-2]|uniref:DUF4190 domain-containing protein n=1 Tax=Arthrobacter sp. MSA 4-2 TaxID=2794349 RepID=UPI0018E7E5CA|nr:DUF4190 domain-containing protein [Arthrobacter sp. MSA 4-2]MBJ2120676.1 DUF4190 domain-containing protein [Arthrobacter sp. MSA 4-2]